jgi:hypothetical protein
MALLDVYSANRNKHVCCYYYYYFFRIVNLKASMKGGLTIVGKRKRLVN